MVNSKVFFFRIKAYFQRLHQARPSPQNPDNAILDSAIHEPLFDANWHSRLVNDSRPIISRELWYALLICSGGKFLHLRCRQEILIDKCDGVHPLYRSAAVPAGHNQPDWRTVVFAKGLPVHLRGRKILESPGWLNQQNPI